LATSPGALPSGAARAIITATSGEARVNSRMTAFYRVRAKPGEIEDRARAIAVEQSVEMPLEAIRDKAILTEVVGDVRRIADSGQGWFDVEIALASKTVGDDAGQLLNMLYGNSSIHEDVVLADFRLPDDLLAKFEGPRQGLEGLRRHAGAKRRALTCTALKPQGLAPEALGEIAFEFARGGVDFVKDDHSLAEQDYSPFADRVRACARAVRRATDLTGSATQYVPNLSGHFGQMQRQMEIVRAEGLGVVMVAPALAGVSTVQGLSRAHPDIAFLGHPTMAGGARISPVAMSRLFRLIGADAIIFTNYGGRFGISKETCGAMAAAARDPWGGKLVSVPTPAGGMTPERVPELLDFYGPDTMLLVGGALLKAPPGRLADETAAFARAVAYHEYGAHA
jgi:ribulose-bisphosphate carboxylase large chain